MGQVPADMIMSNKSSDSEEQARNVQDAKNDQPNSQDSNQKGQYVSNETSFQQ